MLKTKVRKGDKVIVFRGEFRHQRGQDHKPLVGSVLAVDRGKGVALIEMPRPAQRRGERGDRRRGLEVWKTARYNAQKGEQGGLKVTKRPIHVSNLKVVERGPGREWTRP